MLEDYFRQYGLIAVFTVVAVVLPGTLLVVSWLFSYIRVRPHKPTETKRSPYECGMELIGDRWPQFNFRYYMFAILFVIFDVETIFIYPWGRSLQTAWTVRLRGDAGLYPDPGGGLGLRVEVQGSGVEVAHVA